MVVLRLHQLLDFRLSTQSKYYSHKQQARDKARFEDASTKLDDLESNCGVVEIDAHTLG